MNDTTPEREQQPAQGNHLGAGRAVGTATIQIIRAGTGKVETYDLTFTEQPQQPQQEG